MPAQPFMSTTNKRALDIQAKINDKLEGAFSKPQKKRKKKKKQIRPTAEVMSPRGQGDDGGNDDSPPGEDNERLSKRDDESSDDDDDGEGDNKNGKVADGQGSSDGELPSLNVPEVISEEEEELDTIEIQDASRRAMQGSFLPLVAIFESQKSTHDP